MKVLKLFSIILLASFSHNNLYSQNCSQLKNGTYKIEYDRSFKGYKKYIYEFINDTCYITGDTGREKFQITRSSNCTFRLKSEKPLDESNMTDFQKIISKQKPFYDIYKVDKNMYWFVLRVDLHVQECSGKFILLE